MVRRQASYWVGLALWFSASATAQPPRQNRPVLALSAETQQFLEVALAETIKALPSDSAPVCLILRGPPPGFAYPPPPLLLASLQTGPRRVVPSHACPQTYDRMSVLRDSGGRDITPVRPPGYIDPHVIVVDQYALVGADSATMRAVAHQGSVNRHYRCAARRLVDRVWRASCKFLGQTMSALPANVSLQLTSARSKEAIAVSAYRVAIARTQVSRILSRSLAAELGR